MASIKKVCAVCNAVFRVPPSREKSAKTCSMTCKGKLWTTERAGALPQMKCQVCGNPFSYYPSHGERRKTCSRVCSGKLKAQSNSRSGVENHNWKGGISKHSRGYLYRAVEDHPFSRHGNYVFDHRLVMEEWMRDAAPSHKFLIEVNGVKYLRTEIHVHHIDENKQNNGRKNLLACTADSHQLIHAGNPPMCGDVWPEIEGQVPYKPVWINRICELCGVGFLKRRSYVARGAGKFCSRTCYDSRPKEAFYAIQCN